MNIKKFGIALIGLLFSCFSAMTIAAPNSKANQKAHDKVKTKAKVSILHCGCNDYGNGLEWKELKVSANAIGHKNHVEGHETYCIDEETDVITSYTRGADDCEISEDLLLLDATCDLELLDSLDAAEELEESVSCELVDPVIVVDPPVTP
jgi:hypothetical protein